MIKFFVNWKFPQIFRRIARNSAETVCSIQGVIIVYQLKRAQHWWRNVTIDLSFASAFLCEPNSVIKSCQTGIWKWCRKRPLLLSCLAKNYSNLNFNEHEKAGNKVALNWKFLLVNGKAKRAQKNSLQNITAVFSLSC